MKSTIRLRGNAQKNIACCLALFVVFAAISFGCLYVLDITGNLYVASCVIAACLSTLLFLLMSRIHETNIYWYDIAPGSFVKILAIVPNLAHEDETTGIVIVQGIQKGASTAIEHGISVITTGYQLESLAVLGTSAGDILKLSDGPSNSRGLIDLHLPPHQVLDLSNFLMPEEGSRHRVATA